MAKKELTSADLHTPDELLAAAKIFIKINEPHYNRAVILESFAALEGYIESIIFDLLANKIDPLLVEWMKYKTNMDFQSRVETFVPVALSQPKLNKGEGLWQKYQEARNIRNLVVHSGYIVSHNEAQRVLSAVSDWMAYLSSTGDIERSLWSLKKYIEDNKKSLQNASPEKVELSIYNYFHNTTPAKAQKEVRLSSKQITDLILTFGKTTVGMEIKYVSGQKGADYLNNEAYRIAEKILQDPAIDRVVLVVICKFKLAKEFEKVNTSSDGKISLLAISIK